VVAQKSVFAWLLMMGLAASSAEAQHVAAELDVSAGISGEQIGAAASQLRVFGQAPAKIDVFVETAWGDRWAGDDPVIGSGLIGMDPLGTDVFGSAYPYKGRITVMEAYAERTFTPRGAILGVRGGRYRMPFGIHNRSDFGYSGFTRPPLIRYDGYFALSNNWLEEGVVLTAGIPQLFVESSVSRPRDVGSSQRREGTDFTARAQGYFRELVVGVSYLGSEPYMPARFASGRQKFTGVDLRWSHRLGILARGEYLSGQSYQGVSTEGWYLDGALHRPGMGPFTAVVRGEALEYYSPDPSRAREAQRFTVGTRVRLPGPVTLQLNYLRQRGDLPHIKTKSIDLSMTYSIRVDR